MYTCWRYIIAPEGLLNQQRRLLCAISERTHSHSDPESPTAAKRSRAELDILWLDEHLWVPERWNFARDPTTNRFLCICEAAMAKEEETLLLNGYSWQWSIWKHTDFSFSLHLYRREHIDHEDKLHNRAIQVCRGDLCWWIQAFHFQYVLLYYFISIWFQSNIPLFCCCLFSKQI